MAVQVAAPDLEVAAEPGIEEAVLVELEMEPGSVAETVVAEVAVVAAGVEAAVDQSH